MKLTVSHNLLNHISTSFAKSLCILGEARNSNTEFKENELEKLSKKRCNKNKTKEEIEEAYTKDSESKLTSLLQALNFKEVITNSVNKYATVTNNETEVTVELNEDMLKDLSDVFFKVLDRSANVIIESVNIMRLNDKLAKEFKEKWEEKTNIIKKDKNSFEINGWLFTPLNLKQTAINVNDKMINIGDYLLSKGDINIKVYDHHIRLIIEGQEHLLKDRFNTEVLETLKIFIAEKTK